MEHSVRLLFTATPQPDKVPRAASTSGSTVPSHPKKTVNEVQRQDPGTTCEPRYLAGWHLQTGKILGYTLVLTFLGGGGEERGGGNSTDESEKGII